MDGEKRRYNILENLKQTSIPLSGSLLADAYGVSRQVIVQDIALLRAQKHD
ncbi:MAG: HTH domain-containing protein, partial [Clostridia bacterium]|nr:HTH domain-containing protein [Clostridia bacterium]